RRITAATWGSPALAGRTIYKATIRSLIAYGCEAWFSKDIAKPLLESLQKAQNSCLRAILGAYKATPLPIIHEDLEMPRIKDYLKQRWTQYRLVRTGTPQDAYLHEKLRELSARIQLDHTQQLGEEKEHIAQYQERIEERY